MKEDGVSTAHLQFPCINHQIRMNIWTLCLDLENDKCNFAILVGLRRSLVLDYWTIEQELGTMG